MGALPSAAVPTSVQLGDHTRRHIAARLLPFLFVLYVANYIDRTNLAYAALGMSRDLGFTDRTIGLGVGIFFVTYVAGQTPGALLDRRQFASSQVLSLSCMNLCFEGPTFGQVQCSPLT